MRQAAVGVILGGLGCLLALVVFGQHDPVWAQTSAHMADGPASGVIAFNTPLGETRQQLTIIDPVRKTLCIYHVETGTGTVTLKSVRNIKWDLHLLEFNGTSPRPQDIRSMVSSP